jgi:hypothetical protein
VSPLVTLLYEQSIREVVSGVHALHLGLFHVSAEYMKQAEKLADAAGYAAELEARVQTLERARL